MYQKFDIWKRVENGLMRFQCLKRLSDGMFAVQNTDYIRAPFSGKMVQESDLRFVELLLEEDPTDRCDWYGSLDEAISQHPHDFEGMPGKI